MAATSKAVVENFGPTQPGELRHSATKADTVPASKDEIDADRLWQVSQEQTELSFQYKRQIVRLNYDLTGNTEGSTILLIHGFLSSNAQWMPNIEALGRDHKLVLVELWGHGESPTPEAADFTIERYDHELEQIRLELGINQWSVVGQSYAAGLVVRYSINHPERTHRIVVTNSRSAFSDLSTHQRHSPQEGSTQIMKQTSNRHLPIHPIHAKRLPEGIKTRLVEMADNIVGSD